MKLFGHAMSLMTWQVLLTLTEKNLQAEAVSIDVRGREQRGPDHLRRHPFGHIPVLEDDGFQLYETEAIMRYLDERDGKSSLSPGDPQSRARQNQWLSALDTYLYPAVKKVTTRDYARLVGDPDPGDINVEQGRRDLERALAVFNAYMAGRTWIGEGYSLADIRWGTFVDEFGRMMPGTVDDTLRNLAEWLERIRHRPAWPESVQLRDEFSSQNAS